MAILVVCPGCKKSFNVDDKYAGKTGPCPKCKTKITIPEKLAEVKVHAPDEFAGGGRGASGKLALKPIARTDVRFKPLMALLIAGAVVAAIAWAFGIRVFAGGSDSNLRILFSAVGLLLVSPPLAAAAYTFLRDDELEPYRGPQLYIRAAICSVVYMILWAVFAYLYVTVFSGNMELPYWFVAVAPFLGIGAATGKFAFDLETISGFFHYAFYIVATFVLGLIAIRGWVW